ncbi:PilZ domain-containing protein [Pseudomonas duriflava]|uniref:Cyclic diguanosine monophosphate-binding protein n=1 Tax=Pseudomonas duriflava TaxID=459528 RepID=A0A562QC56_9PSED|nr:PilZ domain-containing protein [Pseudomonas duriflava]TWI54299.1 PilZ domain-containing protein [Pseudomonas duriflava]
MNHPNEERRRFKRFPFDATADISQGVQRWSAPVHDISLKGVLIQKPLDWQGEQQQSFEINIQLDTETQVCMQAELAHVEADQLGFACQKIDLDSISHLRRLVELNLGDETLLGRELAALGKE